ncbi:hypothetical protein EAS64_42000 [Trebonia kvetii]|uniref:Uncharacterized protein n=1 Tax=Trebonia kvetii TaxID=2480626 RepID=A0A6P2BMX2_9ACTN|nr:hypothetical protein [Trebonia kvetii]TVY99020.1 hypothetical protein EAS64_42000 [Trebonia kvetii]
MPRWVVRLLSASIIAAFAVGGAGMAGGAAAASVAGRAAVAAPAAVSAPAAGSASAAGRAAAPQTTPAFIWHTLPLVNGWKSASKPALVTGTPAWALSKGVLYLRGAIMQTVTDGNATFAQLPQAAWPASNLYFDVWTNGDVAGIVYVSKTGQMEAYAGNSAVMTSLAAVSYPATTMKSHKLALENGWVSSQSVWGTGNPSYEVSGGVVYLSGSMEADGQHLAAVLPTVARPKHVLYVQVYNYGGTPGWLEIFPNGNLEAFGPAAKSYTSLAGVSFPTATAAWKAFKLEDGWTSAAGKFHTYGPAWTVINGIVYFTGSIYQASGSIGLWTTLPAGVKTTADVLEIETDASGGNPGIVSVTDSLGLVGSAPYSNAQAFTSLAGIAYPQSY